MKAEELKTKTEDELKKMLLEARKEQLNLRFQRSGGTLDNTSLIRNNRRSIARIKTVLSQKVSNDSAQTKAPAKKAEAKKPAAKKAPAKKAAEKKTTTKAKSDKKSDDKAA